MNLKKTLIRLVGVVAFITIPTLVFYGVLYLKYDEELPVGIQGEQADALANKMLNALNYEAYQKTNYLEWTFKKRHHFRWDKDRNLCTVYWREFKVDLNLKDKSKSKAFVHNFEVDGEQAENLIIKAEKYFNNDSFWLVAPYKAFDDGTERRLVTLENGSNALLVTYTSGGTTPGDSYLWILENNGRPKSFKMWTSILPIKGLEATWDNWITTESGAILSTYHKFLFFGIELTDIQATL